MALIVLLPLSFRAAVTLHPEGGEGAEQKLLKLLPPSLLELVGPLLGLRGYGAPGARSEVEEAQWHPATDPANRPATDPAAGPTTNARRPGCSCCWRAASACRVGKSCCCLNRANTYGWSAATAELPRAKRA